MSDLYGIGSEISMGNMADQNVLERNREIEAMNISNRKDYGDKIKSITRDFNTKLSSDAGEQKTSKQEEETAGTLEGGKTIKTAGEVVANKLRIGQVEGVDYNIAPVRVLDPVSSATMPSELVAGEKSIQGGMTIGTAGNPVLASDIGDAVTDIGKTTGALSKGVDFLGKAGAGLGVATGLLDAGKDVMSAVEGKGIISGDNNMEKASNVAGMISGGLEATGLAMDTTGALAPLGLALNVAGGVAGAVSGALDYFGEKKDEKKVAGQKATALSKVAKPTPIPQEAVDTAMAQVPTQSSGRQNVVRSY